MPGWFGGGGGSPKAAPVAPAEVTAELVGRGSGAPVTQQFWMLATMDSSKIARSETFASEALALEAMGLRE